MLEPPLRRGHVLIRLAIALRSKLPFPLNPTAIEYIYFSLKRRRKAPEDKYFQKNRHARFCVCTVRRQCVRIGRGIACFFLWTFHDAKKGAFGLR